MQIVTANGPKGDADYSKWSYTYNGDYHDIVEGSNELTSKITCYDQVQKATSSKSYSINVTGTRSEEHTSELQSLMRISYAVFCLKTKHYKKLMHSIN